MKIEKYRKRAVEAEAVHLVYPNLPDDIADWCKGRVCGIGAVGENKWIEIDTLEGTMRANYGDYIVKGVAGEFYPVKKDIFPETFEIDNAE